MEPEVFIRENIYLLYAAFCGFLALIIIFSIARRKGRVKVRVKTPLKEVIKWRKPERDGKTIVMRKKKKKDVGWSFTFSNQSLVPLKGTVGGHFAVDVFPEAPKAIDYDYVGKKIDQPKLTKKQAGELNRLNAFLARYSRLPKAQTGTIFWLLVILVIIGIILQIISMRGIEFA